MISSIEYINCCIVSLLAVMLKKVILSQTFLIQDHHPSLRLVLLLVPRLGVADPLLKQLLVLDLVLLVFVLVLLVRRVARDADVLLLRLGNVVRFQQIKLK